MKPSIEKLKKFFTLEAERGYDDKAVFGGLEKMLDSWEPEARVDQLPEDLIQAVRARLRDYNRLSPDSRRDALKGLWNRIRREIGQDITPEVEQQAEAKPAAPPQEEPQTDPTPEHPAVEEAPEEETEPTPAPEKK